MNNNTKQTTHTHAQAQVHTRAQAHSCRARAGKAYVDTHVRTGWARFVRCRRGNQAVVRKLHLRPLGIRIPAAENELDVMWINDTRCMLLCLCFSFFSFLFFFFSFLLLDACFCRVEPRIRVYGRFRVWRCRFGKTGALASAGASASVFLVPKMYHIHRYSSPLCREREKTHGVSSQSQRRCRLGRPRTTRLLRTQRRLRG